MVQVRYTGVDKAAFLADALDMRRRIIAHRDRVRPASTDAKLLDAGRHAIETMIFHFCGYNDFGRIRPEPKHERNTSSPATPLPNPTDPSASLAAWRGVPGAAVELFCGACAWSRRYGLERTIARLSGSDDACTAVGALALRIQWPCPACGRMRWGTRIRVEKPAVAAPLS